MRSVNGALFICDGFLHAGRCPPSCASLMLKPAVFRGEGGFASNAQKAERRTYTKLRFVVTKPRNGAYTVAINFFRE